MKLKTKRKKRTSRKKGSAKGEALLNQVVKLTGLPSKELKQELKEILEKKNITVSHLNLGQLRDAAASYVREIMFHLMDKYHFKKNDSMH